MCKNKTRTRFAYGFLCGGEDATRTHNALRHTTFPMWLLTIRIPLHVLFSFCPPLTGDVCYYTGLLLKNQVEISIFFVFDKLHNFISHHSATHQIESKKSGQSIPASVAIYLITVSASLQRPESLPCAPAGRCQREPLPTCPLQHGRWLRQGAPSDRRFP